MAGPVDALLDFVASDPVAVGFSVILLLFIFGGYLLLRRSIKEFRQGFEGQ